MTTDSSALEQLPQNGNVATLTFITESSLSQATDLPATTDATADTAALAQLPHGENISHLMPPTEDPDSPTTSGTTTKVAATNHPTTDREPTSADAK